MDFSLSEECLRMAADTHMTILQDEEAISEEVPEIDDDIEDLRKSLREAVHDEDVQPKLHCLMIDPSFSMVTVQGEDSGIRWETSSSRSSTPSELCSAAAPGHGVAGRVTIIIDEDQIVRRKSAKGPGGSGRRSRADRKTPLPAAEVAGDAPGRPLLVEVSQPNVRAEGRGGGEGGAAADPAEEKEQRLFRLVSEGSEILNIVVPPKLVTVDEEESGTMVDNLSYLEETLVTKPGDETGEELLDPSLGVTVSDQVPTEMCPPGPPRPVTDPPGAPVSCPPRRRAADDVDYFEVDSQDAPGGPAAAPAAPEETEAGEAAGEGRTSGELERPEDGVGGGAPPPSADRRVSSPAVAAGEDLIGEHLDQAFYGGRDAAAVVVRSLLGEAAESAAPKSPQKESGSALFGSQEDILTPIFLSPGPPKIIDQALLDEPAAMAFLYTDLYEEALGSREKDEDAESMTSERSFHSRHSDREDRGYLEKFVLKDETPVVDAGPAEDDRDDEEEGFRKFSDDSYDLGGVLSQEEAAKKGDAPAGAEEEITDFFRTCASSSPCDAEPFPPSLEGQADGAKPKKKKVKAEAKVPQKAQCVPQPRAEARVTGRDAPPAPSSPTDEAGGKSVPRHPVATAIPQAPARGRAPVKKRVPPSPASDGGLIIIQAAKPVAPPRRKSVLELAPLTPVETGEERETSGGKEQREEEKETASPAETADEGEGDADEAEKADAPSSLVPSRDASSSAADNDASQLEGTQVSRAEPLEEEDIYNEEQKTKASRPDAEDETLKDESRERQAAEGGSGAETTDRAAVDSTGVRGQGSETGGAGGAESAEKGSVTEPARETGRCIIL